MKEESINVPIEEYQEVSGRWQSTGKTKEMRPCDSEDMLEVLSEIQEKFPGRPLGDIWLTTYDSLCPLSFVDPWFNFWMEMEGSCAEYNHLPFGGGMLDQPAIVLDIFSTIRQCKNEYYRWKDLKTKQEAKRRANA